MRVLHPVAAQERFLASGEYRFQCDDVPMRLVERWTLHELNGGALLFRIDQDAREEDGHSLLAEALYDADGRLVRFNVQSFEAHEPPVAAYKADYVFHDAYVQVGIQSAGERQYREFALSGQVVPCTEPVVLMGQTIAAIMAKGQASEVFVPAVRADGAERTEQIVMLQRGQESLEVGRRVLLATCYQINDVDACWLDEYRIPLRWSYTTGEQKRMATLSNYAYARR